MPYFKIFVFISVLALGACASDQSLTEAKKNNSAATSDSPLSDNQITILENGYAQMYGGVKSLGWTDKIFLIRFETDAVEAFGTKLTDDAKDLQDDLEYLADVTPWLDLNNTGMPEIENMKLKAVQKDRLKSFLPIIGRSQPNFERTLLLSNSGVLNQMQHLSTVMLDIEVDPHRRDFLKKAHSTFVELYEDNVVLLNRDYFCHNKGEESKGFR